MRPSSAAGQAAATAHGHDAPRISRLLRIHDVLNRVPLGRSTWYAGIAAGIYPQPVRIGRRAVAWKESDIDRIVEATWRPQ